MLNITVHLSSTTPFSSWAGPRAPARHSRPSLPLPLPDGPHPSVSPPLGTVAAAHPSVSPLPLCSAGSACTAHVTRARRVQAVVGRAPLVGRQGPPLLVPLPPRVGRVTRPPSDSSLHQPPLKRAPRRPPAEFFSPVRRLSHPSMPERRTRFPTDPASASPAFYCRSPSSAPDSV
jgi:hypothetical protein